MTDFRDRFELQLMEAMSRQTPPARVKRRWARRRGLISVAVAFAAAATTLAATHPWSPSVGAKRFNEPPPSQSLSAPPSQELSLLGVLRRQQTPTDRGPATLEALRYVSPKGNQGVRLAYVRSLKGGAATLVPVRSAAENREAPAVADALCLFYGDPAGDGGARSCWSLNDLRAGRAQGQLGTHIYGLVPDSVATVSASFDDGTTLTTPVADNFFDLQAPREQADGEHAPIAARVQKLIWLDQTGLPVGPPISR